MDSKQHLYYALGVLVFAVAKADGKVQKEEIEVLHEIVSEETDYAMDFSYTGIIFDLLEKDHRGLKGVYEWAMNAFETGKHHFSEEMKKEFIKVTTRVAQAFPPTTIEEWDVVKLFKQDLEKLKVNHVI